MSNIDKVKKAQRDVEMLQSALGAVHGGLDTVETMVQNVDEVRRGVRGLVKLGFCFAIVGAGVVIVLRIRKSRDPKPPVGPKAASMPR